MLHREWMARVLADPDNELRRRIFEYRGSVEPMMHLDHHVWQPFEQPLPSLEDVSPLRDELLAYGLRLFGARDFEGQAGAWLVR